MDTNGYSIVNYHSWILLGWHLHAHSRAIYETTQCGSGGIADP